MAAKKKSYKGKKQYGTYEMQGHYAKNKVAKAKRHLKKHPNDKQAQRAAGSIVAEYSRKTPQHKGHFPKAKGYIYDGAGRKERWAHPAGVDRDEKRKKPCS